MMSAPYERSVNIKAYARPKPRATFTEESIIQIGSVQPHKLVVKAGHVEKRYTFDYAFREDASQAEVYSRVVEPMVLNVIQGYNCTALVYGPRNSGKTYTMLGYNTNLWYTGRSIATSEDEYGFVPRAALQLFTELSKSSVKVDYTVRVSIVQIVNEEVRDLLDGGNQLRLYDDPANKGSICMKDVTKLTICSPRGLADVLAGLRSTLNKTRLEQTPRDKYVTFLYAFYVDIREVNSKGEEILRNGQLQLVDLAGNDSSTYEVKSRETAMLNRGLTTLNNVVKSLAQKSPHAVFRDSKLTRLLQHSLGGNCKTAVVATYFSSAATNPSDSLHALEFAQLAKFIKNTPQVNINRRPANLFQEIQDEVNKLKAELSIARSGHGFYISHQEYNQLHEDNENGTKRLSELLTRIRSLEETLEAHKRMCQILESSFVQTRDHLQTVKGQLAEKKQVVKEGAAKLVELNKKHNDMTETANNLLAVVKTATTREDIYYNKFQARCLTNEQNIKISKEMVASAMRTLHQSLEFAKQFGFERSRLFYTVEIACKHLQEEQERSAGELEVFPRLMQEHAEAPTWTEAAPSEICGDYSQFFDEAYPQNHAIGNYAEDIATCFEYPTLNFENAAHTHQLSSRRVLEDVQNLYTDRAETRAPFVRQNDKMFQALAPIRDGNVELDGASERTLFQEQAEAQARWREENDIQTENKLFVWAVNEMEDQRKIYQNALNCDVLQGAAASIGCPQQTVRQFDGSVSNLYHDCENKENVFVDAMTAVEQNMQTRYASEMLGRLQGNLTQRHTAMQQLTSLCADGVESSIASVPNLEPIQTTLNSINSSYRNQGVMSREQVDQRLSALGELQDRIQPIGHVGDTPVRQTYSYPREF